MQQAILFLLRTYNDIDHIAPVVWKTAISGRRTYFTFVDQSYLDDYRIQFVIKTGAKHIRCMPIAWYHQRLRRWIIPRRIRRIVDRFVAYTIGSNFLKRNNIRVIANEWSGMFGREMAEYFLRAANQMKIRSVSLPHGYIIWKNMEINQLELDLWETKGRRPDFSERNTFSVYVVQNDDARRYYMARGVRPEKIEVLGSARFCPEWYSINSELMTAEINQWGKESKFVVLFFVPDWEYNVDRQACVALLKKIAAKKNVSLEIKANTRGTGSFNQRELDEFLRHCNVTFPNIDQHSTVLIKSADVVINFASSIGMEAILQGKPVCNPVYLNGNTTIFDKSGVVFDARGDNEVFQFLDMVKGGKYASAPDGVLSRFMKSYVLGEEENGDVLRNYEGLFFRDVNS